MGKLSNLRQQQQHRKNTWQETGLNHEELSVLAGLPLTDKTTAELKQKQKKKRSAHIK